MRNTVSVHVRIDAGNRRTTPDLEGRVTVVSPDLTRDPEATPKGMQTQPYYAVRVAFSEESLKATGDLQLVPGMPAEVTSALVTARRSNTC
jgi:HlyD family secretion protein